MKKYFEILELDMSASIEDVEKAYKELAEAWRPESYQNLPRFKRKAEIKLKEVNDAYERLKSYLLVQQTGEAQQVFAAPADLSTESETETRAVEATHPAQDSTPARRKPWIPTLIAVVVALSALVFYLVSDYRKPQEPDPETIVTEDEKPTSAGDAAAPPVAADRYKKESESEPAGEPGIENQFASTKTAPQDSALLKRSSGATRLTREALRRYNRNPLRVKRIQNGLITIGYNPGPIDGVIGPQTTEALEQFADDHHHIIETGGLLVSDFTDAVLVFAEVSAAHSDWGQIVGTEDFARWLNNQKEIPANRVNQIKKSASARQVIEILNLYKSGKQKP